MKPLTIEELKFEAVKEFAEKLLELYTDPDIPDNYVVPVGAVKQNIKDLLKEYENDR